MNMDAFVKAIRKALIEIGITAFNTYRNGPVFTVYITCTKDFYTKTLSPVLLVYGGVTQNWEEVEGGRPGEGQLWRYTIVFINRYGEE